jgi:hypothetical protein
METVANKTTNRKSPLSLPIIALVAAIIVSGFFVFYFPREKVYVVDFSLQAGAPNHNY